MSQDKASNMRRTQRMASLIRAELARLLIEEISDPSLKEILITDVTLSKDLKHARVFFAKPGEVSTKEEKEMYKGFTRAIPFLKRKIGDNLQLRFIPQLEFERDRHGESVTRLLHLFEEVEQPKKEDLN